MQLTVLGGRDIGKNLDIGGAAPARVQQYIKFIEQQVVVGFHRHDPAALAAATDFFRTIKDLYEIQAKLVDAWLQWDVVSKVSLAAAAVDVGILCAPDVLDRTSSGLSPSVKAIGTPRFSGTIDVTVVTTSKNSDLVPDR